VDLGENFLLDDGDRLGKKVHGGSCRVGFATCWGKALAARNSRRRRSMIMIRG
jgi:hypothetical protein